MREILCNKYEVLRTIAEGGMGCVYLVKDLHLNRLCAVKVSKGREEQKRSFAMAEKELLKRLTHPGLPAILDFFEEKGNFCIVMEYVEGITLKTYIEKKGQLSFKEAVSIAIQVGRGIEAAHNKNIVHRDIKPQNIMISTEGKVKVTDFGIAKAATSNTITSNAMGSVHYISPEQARGGYSDEKSDIYSLGVTLYEMLSGKVPFEGESTVTVALAHIQNEATTLEELDATIPLSLSKIVQKCMQKKPDMRYMSSAALISDLKRSLSEPDGDYVNIVDDEDDFSPTIKLSDINDKVKEKFKDLTAVQEGTAFFITYRNALMPPTGEEDLHRITITLNTNEWKGA